MSARTSTRWSWMCSRKSMVAATNMPMRMAARLIGRMTPSSGRPAREREIHAASWSAPEGRRPSPVAPPPGSLDEVPAKRLGHRGGPVRRPELLEDVLEVRLHGVGRDEQLVRDVLVRVPEGKELEDLDLSGRQGLGLPIALLRLGELVGQRHHELRVDD